MLPAAQQEEVFCAHWAQIKSLLQEKRTVGRSGFGELTAFLRHYLAMRTGVLCNENSVYERFRDRMNREFSSASSFAQEVETLHHYAVHYDYLLRPERQPGLAIREALQRISVLDISTAYPFLLAVSEAYRSGAVTVVEYVEALHLLENYLMRRFLAEEPTNYLNKMFPTLWHDIEQDTFAASLQDALVARKYPSDTRIRQKLLTHPLYQQKSNTRDQITFLLEQVNQYLSAGSGGYTVLSGNATIEHILPQNPGEVFVIRRFSATCREDEFYDQTKHILFSCENLPSGQSFLHRAARH